MQLFYEDLIKEEIMSRLMKKYLMCFGILVVLLPALGLAQDDERLLPRFDFEIVTFPSQGFQQPETYVYVWVRNTHLQYVTSDSGFTARYQINIGVRNLRGRSILTEDRNFSVFERSYATTIDPKVQRVHRFYLELPADEYQFQIRLLDRNSNRLRLQDRRKTVRAFRRNQIEISDVLFISEADTNAIPEQSVIPSFRIPIQERIFIFAEIISPLNKREIKVESVLRQKDGPEGFTFSQEIVPQQEITKVFLQINKESMMQGENQLLLRASGDGQIKTVRKDLRFVAGMQTFEGLPVNDLIGPLIYVTDADDWKKLVSAPEGKKDSVFRAFWDQRNPSPGAPNNPLFDEFYRRVEFANRMFSHTRREGWRTDRGRVYIVFGPPDRVERTTPSQYYQGEYEVWYYDDLREKFVFYDEYGFGDYRLVSGNIRPSY